MRRRVRERSLAEQFRTFAVVAERDGAPLYRRLSEGIAGDRRLLGLLAEAPPSQRRPTLLLAAVHYLLLAGAGDEDGPAAALAARYPTVAEWRCAGAAPEPPLVAARSATGGGADGDTPADLSAFCLDRRDRMIELLSTRSTQTNEVGRCTGLLPALATAASGVDPEMPLSLLDLGASAGLNLLLDRYAYRYRDRGVERPGGRPTPVRRAGDPASPVALEAEILSGELPRLALPPVAHRAGLDRHPVDPTDDDQALWLLACQWPDHLERFRRLRAALALARATPDRPRVDTGDVVDDLAAAARSAPGGTHLCVTTTWVAAYLDPRRQRRLVRAVAAVAAERPVSWILAESAYEVPGLPVPPAPAGRRAKGATALVLVDQPPGRRGLRARRLADVHHHGRWLHWWG